MTFDDRGVTDVVSYVLVFSILISSVAFVATVGFDQVERLEANEQRKSAQYGMLELAEAVGTVHQRTDLSRQAGLELNGATLSIRESSLRVTVSDGTTTVFDRTASVWALAVRRDEATISYEGGGVFVEPGGIVLRQPAVSCDPERGVAVVSLLSFQPRELYLRKGADTVAIPVSDDADPTESIDVTGIDGIPSDGSVTLTASHVATTILHRQQYRRPHDVSIDYTAGASPAGWARIARDTHWRDTGTALVCQDVAGVIVRTTTIGVEIDG